MGYKGLAISFISKYLDISEIIAVFQLICTRMYVTGMLSCITVIVIPSKHLFVLNINIDIILSYVL